MATPHRILLVEDDRSHARLLTRWLTDAGYAVEVVGGVVEATARLAEGWSILVSDIDLPDGSGLDLAGEFKRATRGRPVLLLTAHGQIEVALQALRAKVDDLMLKLSPLRPDTLCQRIASLLANHAEPAPETRVLAIGAHPDDVELGCGATLARHAALGHAVTILTLTAGESGGDPEQRRCEAAAAAEQLRAHLQFADCRDQHLTDGGDTLRAIEDAVREVAPTTIYVHTECDTHQDHRAVARATLVAARRIPNVLGYQSPSTTIDFRPTMFVDVERYVDRKLAMLEAHASQQAVRAYLERDLVVATTRYWGRFASTRHAEPFQVMRALAAA